MVRLIRYNEVRYVDEAQELEIVRLQEEGFEIEPLEEEEDLDDDVE